MTNDTEIALRLIRAANPIGDDEFADAWSRHPAQIVLERVLATGDTEIDSAERTSDPFSPPRRRRWLLPVASAAVVVFVVARVVVISHIKTGGKNRDGAATGSTSSPSSTVGPATAEADEAAALLAQVRPQQS